jgi:hypothetical protein
VLWLFTRQRTEPTAAGERVLARLAPCLAELDELPQRLMTDPPAALRLARVAGPLLLLSAGARRALPHLRSLAAVAAYALLEGERESEWLDLFEHAEALLSIDTDLLFALLDAIADFADGGSTNSDGARDDSNAGDGGDGGGGGGD